MKKGTQATLDLAQIGSMAIKSEGASKPVLIAAITQKGEGERVSELLKDVEGLEVVSVAKDEDNDCDVINFVEDAQMDENCIAYKHDDNVVFIVSGVKSSTVKMDFWADSTSFKENIQKTSFFPNLREASYTLVDTIANIVYAEADADVAKKADAEVSAFGEYVKQLVSSLPVTVMKSIEAIDFNKADAKKDEEPEATVTDEDKDKNKEGEALEGEVETTATKTEGGEPEADPAPAAKTEGDEGSDPAPAAKTEDETPAWALALVSKVDSVSDRINTLEESVQATAQKAEEAVEATNQSRQLVEKAEGVLRGTITADAQDEQLDLDDDYIPDQANDDELREAGIESY